MTYHSISQVGCIMSRAVKLNDVNNVIIYNMLKYEICKTELALFNWIIFHYSYGSSGWTEYNKIINLSAVMRQK